MPITGAKAFVTLFAKESIDKGSNLGIVQLFVGANLVLDVIKLIAFPASLSILKYTTAHDQLHKHQWMHHKILEHYTHLKTCLIEQNSSSELMLANPEFGLQ